MLVKKKIVNKFWFFSHARREQIKIKSRQKKVVLSSFFNANTNAMSSKRSRENVQARPTTKRVKSERNDNRLLWRLVTDHPDIFDTYIVTKLNGNDVKFFYDVNTESRRAVERSGARLPVAFTIGDFDTKSTISWALEKCSEEKERFCAEMA